ncbi:TPA: hypothetical protein DEO28_02775 [Candidatus Dependentiae bacterium]|nr:MAG: Ribosome-binding factor A [candidate division TM6 bacterium GW2011_GWE2_31_21]KKP53170.1 MAG: Ribosome-binding factor A [candidate division TM6 bacterium GW2011_GWF2_33_332]HBS47989.1 hypothetical protein [Candidatus Dependentiae bacterium]HBZ73407.1 hypothetical protein [Candidatus Dependentiae bacterium]
MHNKNLSVIKKERRKSFFLRELSNLIFTISQNEPLLISIRPSRVEFSEGEGMCFVYFEAPSKEVFDNALKVLTLYKPSVRKALSKSRQSRFTPDLLFKYDEILEKSRKIEELLDKAKQADSKLQNDK